MRQTIQDLVDSMPPKVFEDYLAACYNRKDRENKARAAELYDKNGPEIEALAAVATNNIELTKALRTRFDISASVAFKTVLYRNLKIKMQEYK